jgi:hypothetical protein
MFSRITRRGGCSNCASRACWSSTSRTISFQVHRIAERVVIMENGEKVADVQKHEMTAEELEHIIRDGGRQVGEAAA